MRNLILATAATAAASLPGSALGQEALKNYQSSTSSAATLRRQAEDVPYTVQWGKFSALLSASLDSEWTDNVRYTSGSPEEDFIFRPMLNARSILPITEFNSLKFSFGVGYEKFLDNDQYDRLIIQPGSEISLNLMAGDFLINFHDRFSYENDPGRSGEFSNIGQISTLENTAGILATWDLEHIVSHFGYDFHKVVATTSGYDYMDRDTHLFLARSGVRLQSDVIVGIELSGGPTYYVENILNDNIAFTAGAYAQWQPTEYLRFLAQGGYIYYTFDESLLGEPPDFDGYYLGFNANHILNEQLSYSIDAGRHIQPGYESNLIDLWQAGVTTHWRVIRDVDLTLGFIYEKADRGVARGISDEYDRYGVRFGAGYRLTEKLQTRLNYTYYLKDGDRASQDYDQNRVTLTLTYTF